MRKDRDKKGKMGRWKRTMTGSGGIREMGHIQRREEGEKGTMREGRGTQRLGEAWRREQMKGSD